MTTRLDNISERKIEETLEEIKRFSTDYVRISKKVGLSPITVRDIDITINRRFVITEDGYGRYDIRRRLIARRHVDTDGWDETNAVIRAAKSEYDNGTVELATGRDGFWLLLYRFPRRVKDAKREPYFTGETV